MKFPHGASSVFVLVFCTALTPAFAQSVMLNGRHTASHPSLLAKKSTTATNVEAITVVHDASRLNGGGGMMRLETAPYAVQTIAKEYIDMKSPASTALDLARTSPSMNIATTDTSGMQGGYIESRSLTDADMGLMMDGAPAQSAQYLTQDIDAEDLDAVTVTPGSSEVSLPITTAAAGVLDERSHTPSHKFGGLMDFSYGTNNLSREFLRLESGEIANTGTRSYFSFSNTHARSWMGAGINERRHIDFGVQKDFNNGSTVKLFLSWYQSNFVVDNYATAEQFYIYKHTGAGFDRSSSYQPGNNNYWKDNIDNWNQVFVTVPVHIVLPHKMSFDIQPYLEYGRGWNGYNDGTPSQNETSYYLKNGSSVSSNQDLTEYYMQNYSIQVGATAKLGYDIDHHNHAEIGYWYEKNYSETLYPISATLPDGGNPNPDNENYALYNVDGSRAYGGPIEDAGYELHSIFIQDSACYLHNKMRIIGGFKYAMINYWERGDDGSRTGKNNKAPLPHLSVSYDIDNHHQVYANAEGNYRQPNPSNITVNPGSSLPKNQYTISEQIGYRYHDKYVMIDISLFNYTIKNRLLNTYIGNNEYGVINAGNQTARGFDIMVSGRPMHHFSPYASFEYLHATMESNIAYGDSYMNTKGKQAVMAPRIMANFGISYNSQGFFGNFSLHYAGPQAVTLMNDERMPGYVSDTLTLGYHFKPFYYAKSPTLRLNFTNLTGSIVRTGTTGVATNARPMTLTNGATVSDTNEATFLVEPRFSMTGTISTSF